MEQKNKKSSPGEILIIEDEPASLKLLAGLLEKSGYTVRTAQDGKAGLLSAKARMPDLILLDIRMPEMDGFEVCRRLKADPDTASASVIFLSALPDAENKIEGFRIGAVDYITKPYQAEEVLLRVHTHAELHKLHASMKNLVHLHTMKLEEEIAERRKLEEILREEKNFSEALVESLPGVFFSLDTGSHLVGWNSNLITLLGQEKLEMAKANALNAIHEEDKAQVAAKIREGFENGHAETAARLVLSDGEARHYYFVGRTLNINGQVFLLGTGIDISERKQAEDELRKSEEHFRAYFEHSMVGMATTSLEKGWIYVNDALCESLGYSREELVRMTWAELTHPDDLAPDVAQFNRVLNNEINSYAMDKRFIHKDGHVVYTHLAVSCMRKDDGSPDYFVALVEDITERKQAEERIRESEERFRLMADSAQALIWVSGPDKLCTWFNKEWLDFTGRTMEQEIGNGWAEGVHSDDLQPCLDIYTSRFDRREPFHMEYRLKRHDGEYRWIYDSGAPRFDKNGNFFGYIGSCFDITERKQAEDEARNAHKLLMASIQQMPVAYVRFDNQFRVAEWNKAAESIFGFTRDEIMGKHPFGLFVQEELRPVIEDVARKLLSGIVADYSASGNNIRKDGTVISCKWHNRPLVGMDGKISGVICMAEDVTEHLRAESALRLQSEITANAAEGIALIGADDGIIQYVNRQFEALFGYGHGELTGKHISIINAPTDKTPQETADGIMRTIKEYGAWNGELLNQKKDGTKVWTSGNVSTFQHPELGMLLITYQRDITEKKKSEEMIWKQANFDQLTGLPNRHMFHDRLVQEIKKANRTNQKLALMFVDLDRFKEVNDTLGHDMGDILLREATRRINDCVRATDMVARMGGDEFTITMTDIADIGSVERVAQAILLKLAEPFHLETEVAFVSGSIGITLYPDDSSEIEGLLKNADQAMYVAKNLGRNRHSYFTHALHETAQTRLHLVNDLRGALAAGQFMVYFQPIVDMATGAIYKAEALIRWQHPERGMVSPAEFIPLAEETGLIFEIGDWVFNESVHWVKRWREAHHPEFQVSVNKSPMQFYKHSDEHSAWLKQLHELGLPGQSIVIEITEGLLMGAEPAIGDALFSYRDAGIQIAIDDFGTGYSSLAYLNRFNIDYLKIDQSFTRNITPDSNDMALAEAIIVMAHKLDLKVIAEGVETETQRDLLAAAGCDYAQGYLYSRAVAPEEFEKLLKHG